MVKRALIAAVTASALACACGSPTAPTGGGVDRLTATIDGQPFSASIVVATIVIIDGTAYLDLSGFNGCQGDTALQLTLQPATATGTFTTGISSTLNRIASGQSVGVWHTDTGWVTITSLSPTRVAGSFSFPTLPPLPTAVGSRSVTNGSFDVQVADRKIC